MGKYLLYGMIKGLQLAQKWRPAAAIPFPELANGVQLLCHLGTTPPFTTTKLKINQEWVPELGLAWLQPDLLVRFPRILGNAIPADAKFDAGDDRSMPPRS